MSGLWLDGFKAKLIEHHSSSQLLGFQLICWHTHTHLQTPNFKMSAFSAICFQLFGCLLRMAHNVIATSVEIELSRVKNTQIHFYSSRFRIICAYLFRNTHNLSAFEVWIDFWIVIRTKAEYIWFWRQKRQNVNNKIEINVAHYDFKARTWWHAPK